MALIYMNEEELRNIKSKINLAQMKLEGVKASLSADKIDKKRLGEQTTTYKGLFSQLGNIGKYVQSLSDKSDNLMKYVDEVISSYSSTDRNLAGSTGGRVS